MAFIHADSVISCTAFLVIRRESAPLFTSRKASWIQLQSMVSNLSLFAFFNDIQGGQFRLSVCFYKKLVSNTTFVCSCFQQMSMSVWHDTSFFCWLMQFLWIHCFFSRIQIWLKYCSYGPMYSGKHSEPMKPISKSIYMNREGCIIQYCQGTQSQK